MNTTAVENAHHMLLQLRRLCTERNNNVHLKTATGSVATAYMCTYDRCMQPMLQWAGLRETNVQHARVPQQQRKGRVGGSLVARYFCSLVE